MQGGGGAPEVFKGGLDMALHGGLVVTVAIPSLQRDWMISEVSSNPEDSVIPW